MNGIVNLPGAGAGAGAGGSSLIQNSFAKDKYISGASISINRHAQASADSPFRRAYPFLDSCCIFEISSLHTINNDDMSLTVGLKLCRQPGNPKFSHLYLRSHFLLYSYYKEFIKIKEKIKYDKAPCKEVSLYLY